VNYDTTPLVDKAYDGILQLIRGREINLEEQVSQRGLAERLGISKLPITMALDRLKRDGLVQSEPRRGTRLLGVNAEGVWDMIQWRSALEVQAARLAAQWITPEQREPLMAVAAKADFATFIDDSRPDVAFHLRVAECSGSRRLRAELERLDIYHMKVMMCEAVSAARRHSPAPPPSHEEVANVILEGRSPQAGELMRSHLTRSDVVFGFLDWYRGAHLPKNHG
jgi:DNA-binding GntR family transcriptional regulator